MDKSFNFSKVNCSNNYPYSMDRLPADDIEPTWISRIPTSCPKPSNLIPATMTLSYRELGRRLNLEVVAQYMPLDSTVLGTNIYNRNRGTRPIREKPKSTSFFQNQCTIYLRLKDDTVGRPGGDKQHVLGFIKYNDDGSSINSWETLHESLSSDSMTLDERRELNSESSYEAEDIIGWKFISIKLFTNGKIILIACTKIQHAEQAITEVITRLEHLSGDWSVHIPIKLATLFTDSKTKKEPDPEKAAFVKGLIKVEKYKDTLMKLAKDMNIKLNELDDLQVEMDKIRSERIKNGRVRPMTLEERQTFFMKHFDLTTQHVYSIVLTLRKIIKCYYETVDNFYRQPEDKRYNLISMLSKWVSESTMPGDWIIRDAPAYLDINEKLFIKPDSLIIHMANCTYNHRFMTDQDRAYKLLSHMEGFTVRSKNNTAVECTYGTGADTSNVSFCHKGGAKIVGRNATWSDCLSIYNKVTKVIADNYLQLVSPAPYLEEFKELIDSMPETMPHHGKIYIKKRTICSRPRNKDILLQTGEIKMYHTELNIDDYERFRGRQVKLITSDHGKIVI